jgi:CHAP domain
MKGWLFGILALAMCASAHAKPLTAHTVRTAALELAPALTSELIEFAPAEETREFAFEPPVLVRGAKRLQCAVYARERSGVELRGAAGAWWNLARGIYDRAATPSLGAVLVLGGTPKGHVAVVSKVLSASAILVDHANWMNKGEIQLGALIEDVSSAKDWSAVRVWYLPSKGLGQKAYPVKGFILPQPAPRQLASLN